MIYTHVSTGHRVTIKKQFGSVCLCCLESPYKKKIVNMIMTIDVMICEFYSLKPEIIKSGQQKLF